MIKTFSGIVFNINAPCLEHINIIDIAESLSKQCRFLGHCKEFYSVAEHSIFVSEKVSDKLWGLLHDAAEAYIGDIITPIKYYLPFVIAKENEILELIAQKFRLKWPMPQEVKIADMRMCDTEMRDLMGASTGQPYTERVIPFEDYKLTKKTFLHFFQNYGGVL